MLVLQENMWEFCSRDYAQVGTIGGDGTGLAYPMGNLIDGDRGTFYKTSGIPAPFTLDLGSVRSVDRVFLRSPQFFGIKSVKVEFGTDGQGFSEIPVVPNGTYGAFTLRFIMQPMRYLRITVLTLPDFVTETRISTLAVFRKHFTCDRYTVSLQRQMPPNPQTRTLGFNGRVLVPLLHGNNVRVQSWGGDRRAMTVQFPAVRKGFLNLLEWYKDRGIPFGIVDHEFEFWNVLIVPGGLRVTELDSDGQGDMQGPPENPEWINPSKSWYSVEVDVQECSAADVVTDEEPPAPQQEGETIMTDTIRFFP